jgi:EAL domain-containing protein (putative c-di-GMP-specific phosphodiesterase class I)
MTATTHFRSFELSSRYQPIFSFEQRSLVGFEGLLVARALDGRSVPPNLLFEDAVESGEELYLDWLARALHLRAFSGLEARGCRLFINSSPRAAVEDARFPGVLSSVLRSFGTSPADVVIEILEHEVADEGPLADAVARYRALGCGIALDDFGTGASGFGRLERLQPDVVKIARSLVRAAASEPWARDSLLAMVARIQSGGAAVVIEGVEDRRDAQVAFDTGAEYVQGYYFGLPSADYPDLERARRAFASLGPSAAPAPPTEPAPIRASGRAC